MEKRFDVSLIVGIQEDSIAGESYSQEWALHLSNRGVDVRFLDLLSPEGLDAARECHGVMWRWHHHPSMKQSAQVLLHSLETFWDIPTFPSSRAGWHYDEKVRQHYMFRMLGIRTPMTWVFWDESEARKFIRSVRLPVVFKLSAGAGSSNVSLLRTRRQAYRVVRRAFRQGSFPSRISRGDCMKFVSGRTLKTLARTPQRFLPALYYIAAGVQPPMPRGYWRPEFGYVYFQEFITGNEFDTRVVIIGSRAFAYRRDNRPKDFRASGSGRRVVDESLIDPEMLRMAFDTADRLGMISAAFDFLHGSDGYRITEVSYTFQFDQVATLPGHWNQSLEWIEGSMSPAEAQVEAFLDVIAADHRRGQWRC